jgi:VanZ family protein
MSDVSGRFFDLRPAGATFVAVHAAIRRFEVMMPVMERGKKPVSPARRARGCQLAWILALAYLLVIVYASLQPFRGWRFPPSDILRFLTAPWPRYITLDDVLINLIAYVPLGFLLALALKTRLRVLAAVSLATLLAAAVSLAMEGVQMFLPARIASNVDLLTNSTGALFGAMAAPLLSPSGFPGSKLAALRRRWFIPGAMADAGLVIVCLWLLTPLHPTAQPFGTGYLRATFDLPAYFFHTPQLLLLAEAAVVFFNLLGLGLLISALMRPARPLALIATVVVTGLAIKSIAAVTLVKSPPFLWLTPGVALGLVAGAPSLLLLSRVPRLAKVAVAAICFCAAVAAINLAPDNPYQNVPLQLLAGNQSHFMNFSSIVRALSELWSFLAVGYLLVAAGTGFFANSRHDQRDRL